MKKYIRIITVSYATRKVLLIKENDNWGMLEDKHEIGTVEALVKKLYFQKLRQNYNFYMTSERYEDTIEKQGTLIQYVWVFTCSEYFEQSSVEYRWSEVEELCVSEKIKQYIKNHINREIIIKYGKIAGTKKHFGDKSANIQGYKQAYSRVIPLKLLHPEIKIQNAPQILDVFYLRQVLEKSNQIQNEFVINDELCYSWGIMNMVPMLLNKHHRVIIQKTPAGCKIGDRTLDLYLYVMKVFGVYMKFDNDTMLLEYKQWKGDKQIEIPIFASFTATSMAVYFALLGKGVTVIRHASIEPEILFLLESIKKLGYQVDRCGRTIRIDSRRDETVSLCQKIIVPIDRNVLVTQLVDAIYEEKNFLYLGQNNLYLDELIKKVKEFNVNIKYDKKSVRIDLPKNGKTYSHHMVFGHYPDLCTDWQPLLTILCIDSEEETFIYDKVFNDRYRYLAQLKQIYPGLEIEIFRNLAILKNMDKDQRNEYLNMQEFPLLDIRAAAVVIIGLSKCAEFYLSNVTQLLRGYENLFQISEYMGENGEYEFRR